MDTKFKIKHFTPGMFKNKKSAKPKRKYRKYVIQYFNKFFFVYKGSKTDYVELDYDKYGNLKGIREQRLKKSFFESNAVITQFIKYWLLCQERCEYDKTIYNPNPNIKIQPYEFNLNCGLKIEIDNPNIDFNDFDENSIEPY